jgi:hypothetical protein
MGIFECKNKKINVSDISLFFLSSDEILHFLVVFCSFLWLALLLDFPTKIIIFVANNFEMIN